MGPCLTWVAGPATRNPGSGATMGRTGVYLVAAFLGSAGPEVSGERVATGGTKLAFFSAAQTTTRDVPRIEVERRVELDVKDAEGSVEYSLSVKNR